MYRTVFGNKTSNEQIPCVDRFVTPRIRLAELSRKVRWGTREKASDDIWCTKHLREKKYVDYLDSAFGLQPETRYHEECVQVWPCRPRTKSYLSSADSILDLPTYSDAVFPELLDWSSDNILVAALGKHYHKWSWNTQSQLSQGFTKFDIRCCKVDPTGKLLTLGTDVKTVEIHDAEQSKLIAEERCRCLNYKPPYYCSITAIDWSPTGNSFIIGCSRGTIVSLTRDAIKINSRVVSNNSIYITRISPDARVVAVAALSNDRVHIFTWPIFKLLSRLSSNWTVMALTWHPWRSALLAIGAYSVKQNTRVALWDAHATKFHKHTLTRNDYTVDTMLFSKRTGELVLSLYYTGDELPLTSCQLVVMSDPDTVVDQWGDDWTGLERIRTMVFSPDGSKIAAATVDEDLIILNFIPEDKQKKKKLCKRFSAIPAYLDEVTVGVSLR